MCKLYFITSILLVNSKVYIFLHKGIVNLVFIINISISSVFELIF